MLILGSDHKERIVLSRVGKADAVNLEPSVDARRLILQTQRVPTANTYGDWVVSSFAKWPLAIDGSVPTRISSTTQRRKL